MATDPFWTDGRSELLRRLQDQNVDLAGFYEQAVDALCPRPITRARFVIAAHALRELISLFPHALGNQTVRRVDDSRAVKNLQAAWSEAALPTSVLEGYDLPALPTEVQAAVIEVVTRGTQIGANARAHAVSVATGVWENRRDATLDRFFVAVQRFQGWAHAVDYDRGITPLPSDALVEQELEIVEAALRTRLGDLAEQARQTLGLLAETNQQREGEWTAPADEMVDRALAPLANPALQRLFFTGLINPAWLKPLQQRRAFSYVPEPSLSADGQEMVAPWPQGDYLVRTAASEPALTREILTSHAATRHPWFQRDLLRAALEMPAAEAAHLVSTIALVLGSAGLWLPEPDLVQLAQQLADGDRPKKFRELLNACFRPRRKDLSQNGLSFESAVETPFQPYWHSELLPKLTSRVVGLGLGGLKLVTGWLELASDFERQERPEWDLSRMRASVAAHEQNHDTYETINAYVDAVRDVAAGLLPSSPREVLDFLLGRPSQIMQRITLETYTAHLRSTPAAIDDLGLEELLLDPRFLDMDYRPEYLHLARAALPIAGAKFVGRWTDLVLGDEWQLDGETIRRIVAYPDGDPSSVVDSDIADWRDRTRFRLLQPLAGSLPGTLAKIYSDYASRFSLLEHPEFSSYVSSGFSGPNSPRTAAELGAMSAEDLTSFLESWEPDTSDHFGPSIEGLARSLETMAASDPSLVAAVAPAAARAHRSFARAAIFGACHSAPVRLCSERLGLGIPCGGRSET